MNRANLENLSKGAKPSLHAAAPDLDTLKGLVERAAESLADSRKTENSLATRFSAAYSAAFWLAFEYGDVVDVSEQQVQTAIAAAQELLEDVTRTFPEAKP